ncbi:MAG: MFS transporter [Candidatus ainarchaeum sp.]|nr:MFS transporter [Candidatus ainarchaeum sp.]
MHFIKYGHLVKSKFGVILLATLIWLAADRMLEYVMPLYLEGIGKSYFEIGLLLSLTALGGLLFDWPLGNLSDATSRRKIMFTSVILSIIASALIFIFEINWVLTILILVWSIAYQMWCVPRDAYLAAHTDHNKRSREYGLFNEVVDIAETIGPLICGALLLYLGYSGIVSIYAVMLGIAALIILFFIAETDHRSMLKAIPQSFKFSAFIRDLKELKYLGSFGLLLLFYSFSFMALDNVIFLFEPLFCTSGGLGLSLSLAGLLMAFFSIPGILFSYLFGLIADKIGKKKVLFAGMICIGLSLILFVSTKNIVLLFAFASLYSIGAAMFLPSLNGLIVDLSFGHQKGKIVGLWDSFTDLGYFIGPLIGGIIAEFYGLREVYISLGVFFIAISLLIFFFVKRK